MKILKNAGNHVVLATWPSKETNKNAQMILEKAGRTCYQSDKWEITPQSAHEFVQKACKRTHFSVIEHGWRGYIFPWATNGFDHMLESFWPMTKYMYFTKRGADQILISANLETWRKLYYKGKLAFCCDIENDLEHFAPGVFTNKSKVCVCHQVTPITSEDQLSDEEQLNHIAHTVQYNNYSRGFTHELVRHRLPVYSQESTRYVDASNLEVVVPPHKDEGLLKDFLTLSQDLYKNLRTLGWKPEDARQILPTGIKAQIVMSCNLLERRYIYYRRTPIQAHWEIRVAMCNELCMTMYPKYPNLFYMFVYNHNPAKDGVVGWCDCNNTYDFFI